MNCEEAFKFAIKCSEILHSCGTSSEQLEQDDINYNCVEYSNYETIVKNKKIIESVSTLDKKRVKNALKKYDKNIKNYFI